VLQKDTSISLDSFTQQFKYFPDNNMQNFYNIRKSFKCDLKPDNKTVLRVIYNVRFVSLIVDKCTTKI